MYICKYIFTRKTVNITTQQQTTPDRCPFHKNEMQYIHPKKSHASLQKTPAIYNNNIRTAIHQYQTAYGTTQRHMTPGRCPSNKHMMQYIHPRKSPA